jgi:homoserine trans-succinylase
MSSLLCLLCYVHCRTQFYHVDIFIFPVSMSHVYFWFRGHLHSDILVILSGMADLNKNIDMTKLEESYKWSGVWQEKGSALVPKKTRVD